jgi:hypothetical protein
MLRFVGPAVISGAAVYYEARKMRLLSRPGLGVVKFVQAHSEARKAGKRDSFSVSPYGPVHADEKALIMAMMRPPIPRPAASAHHGKRRKPSLVSKLSYHTNSAVVSRQGRTSQGKD